MVDEESFRKWEEDSKNSTSMTNSDMWAKLGGEFECERCSNFDLDTAKCNKGKRPRKILMLDGPNEYCHINLSCNKFSPYADLETDTYGLDAFFAV